MTGEASTTSLERLRDPQLELADTMRLLDELEPGTERALTYGLSANYTIDLLGTQLRRHALLHGHRAVIRQGSYGDHIGNLTAFAREGTDVVVLSYLFDALVPSFESQLATMDPALCAGQMERVGQELRLALSAASGIKQVIVPLMHRLGRPDASGHDAAVDVTIEAFNAVLRDQVAAFPNARVMDLGAVLADVGWSQSTTPRFYQRFKAPYTSRFMSELARQVLLMTRGGGAYFYKVLVLDCDNTLWGGTIGEDLLGGIKLSPNEYPGNVYWQAQLEFAALARNGVLVCLCSKNNAADVDVVLAEHPHAALRQEHVIVKQVNWDDKPTNLRRIAKELNVGVDSMVFVDDSAFECEAVRTQVPGVHVVQVPKNIFEYPSVVQQLKELFLAGGITAESRDKTEQYRVRAEGERARAQFASQEEYLASLELQVDVRQNDRASVARIAELTQKSNQFNVTTRRYTDAEVNELMDSDRAAVYSLSVRDRFGDSGLTGVAILRYEAGTAHIDSFLLSCRVIGRGVEFAFWPRLLAEAQARGCPRVVAEYRRTPKNALVEDFFDQLGLPRAEENETRRAYAAEIDRVAPPAQPHIEVRYGF